MKDYPDLIPKSFYTSPEDYDKVQASIESGEPVTWDKLRSYFKSENIERDLMAATRGAAQDMTATKVPHMVRHLMRDMKQNPCEFQGPDSIIVSVEPVIRFDSEDRKDHLYLKSYLSGRSKEYIDESSSRVSLRTHDFSGAGSAGVSKIEAHRYNTEAPDVSEARMQHETGTFEEYENWRYKKRMDEFDGKTTRSAGKTSSVPTDISAKGSSTRLAAGTNASYVPKMGVEAGCSYVEEIPSVVSKQGWLNTVGGTIRRLATGSLIPSSSLTVLA